MKRSEFIRLMGLGAAGALVPGTLRKSRPIDFKRRIVIVGAGMAGIAAARTLVDAGHEVVILEARERLGGRIWTDRSLGATLDLGGGMINHAKDNGLTRIVSQHRQSVHPLDPESYDLYDGRGNSYEQDPLENLSEWLEKLYRRAAKYIEKQEDDLSMRTALESVLQEGQLSPQRRRELEWRISLEELGLGTTIDRVSAKWGHSMRFGGDHLYLPNGFDKVLEKMARGLDIRYGQEVRIIKHKNGVASALTLDDDHEGDFVIVTLPLGVLKQQKIRFFPKMSYAKANAVNKLGVGLTNKVALRFDRAFWPRDRQFLNYMSKYKGEFPNFFNLAHFNKKPVLLASVSREFGAAVEDKPDIEVAVQIHRILYKIFEDAPMPNAYLVSRWGSDPYARGAFSYLPVGTDPVLRDYLAKPEGRIYYAGEATVRQHAGRLQGAYLSGLRAAKWIMAR
ncbi:MAG: FAD-dependent oxidoreductase [Bacteroidota bacterium]